jgi:hypothetical protein
MKVMAQPVRGFVDGALKLVPPPTREDIVRGREALTRLAEAMLARPESEHYAGDVVHTFAPGVYLRTITMKAGSFFVSKIHKTRHSFIFHYGDATIRREDGRIERITGPQLPRMTEAGTQRALLMHADTRWTTIHVTNETDLAAVEAQVIAKDWAEIDALFPPEPMKGIAA